MRIEDLYPPAVRSAEGAGQAEKFAGEERWSVEGTGDVVYLSRLSQRLLSAGQHSVRLEQLRELFQRGQYAIGAGDLSRRLIEFYLEPEGPGGN
ncbi:MAG: hypothetical protein RMI94_06185 [Bryobacterales bacterium]|nr:hypothetical protein [Bryobacteraceae bacterium]MDW8130118.1 hypothetical protein [Bryobacterales bacterium]